ncbi:MAG: folate-binding protein YgfZ [Myxococcales bacterium]|nr:folate-binding protein YgfZ [Myxococcales bacterium]
MTARAFLLDDVILRVTGDDAREWLQGQLTCDVGRPAASDAPSIYGLVLEGTGRILSDAWVLDDEGGLALRVPGHAADAVLTRLDRYIVMEDVELERDGRRVIHLVDGASEGIATPRLGAGGHDLLVPPEEVEPTLAALAARGFVLGDDAAWERARIDAGVPRHGVDFGLDTLPQEAGLWRAVSFQKGCYFGQEPVVMLEHRGKPPKRLVRMELEAPVAPGAAVQDAEGREVGRVTSAAAAVALALVKRRALEAGGIQVGGRAPRALALLGEAP